jgi:hypothetical protein
MESISLDECHEVEKEEEVWKDEWCDGEADNQKNNYLISAWGVKTVIKEKKCCFLWISVHFVIFKKSFVLSCYM